MYVNYIFGVYVFYVAPRREEEEEEKEVGYVLEAAALELAVEDVVDYAP
jgi:hypothetical protein